MTASSFTASGDDRLYTCSICGKNFGQRSHAARHEQLHSGDRPFGCSVCDKRFGRKDTAAKHERAHWGSGGYNAARSHSQLPAGDTSAADALRLASPKTAVAKR